MAWAARVAAVLTGTLVLCVVAQASQGSYYNFRSTYFGTSCYESSAFLIQEYYFPQTNQCVKHPSYPQPELRETMFPKAGKALSVVSCNSTAAVVSVCNDTCGNCTNQTVLQMRCMPVSGGFWQLVNFTCNMYDVLPPASTGRPVDECFGAQVNATQNCDGGDVCDPMSPCNQSLSALWATCPGWHRVSIAGENVTMNISRMKTDMQMQCTPCAMAYAGVLRMPYCDLFGARMCYTDCVQGINSTLQLCNNTVPFGVREESAGLVGMIFRGILVNCATNGTIAPPPPTLTAAITFTYYQAGNYSECDLTKRWPGAAKMNHAYSLGRCASGPWAPTMPAGSYQLRVDACDGRRVVVAGCDATCTCGDRLEIPNGECVEMVGYKQRLTWDRCPVLTLPPNTTTTTAPPPPPNTTTTMVPPPPANTTTPPLTTSPPPTVFVSGSMTVKAATQDAANALVADPQVKTAFATGIGTIAGVDPSLVIITLSVGSRRLKASAAVPPRRLDVSILVSYIIALPANGGTGPGGAPLPSPDAVKTTLTSATPALVQATVTAAYATMKVTPPAFIVDTVTAPTLMVPVTTTTTATSTVGRIGTAGGAEWGARAWLASLLALLASTRCGL